MKRFFLKSFAFLALLAITPMAHADVKLPKIFGDNLVLQQKASVAIWGWGDKGEEVRISLAGATASAKVGDDGRWMTKLQTPAAGGPFELSVAGKNTITLKDVYVGEVWICSGQSNMEWSVAASGNPQEEIANANWPQIRMIKVQRATAENPQDDINGSWAVCSPQTAAQFSAAGYYFARHLHKELNVPVGMINTSWGGTICEAWTSKSALATKEETKNLAEKPVKVDPAKPSPNQPAVLFNAMLNPLVPYGIRGAIWYQGESNVSRAEQYRTLFPTMIADWRARFGQGDFPFLFVQLAPFRYGNNDPRMLAEQWESQSMTLNVPNTGMCVTTDIGNVKDIHPKNKQEVGRRLALWALAKTYDKKDLAYSGPLYDSMAIEGNKIRLKFKHVNGGLVAEGGKPLSHFTIAGEDEMFVEANATIEGDSVVVTSDKVAKPVAVRFAWSDTAEPNFFNKAGLPASPFRTDNFKMLTAGKR